jgi:hypothetical protein
MRKAMTLAAIVLWAAPSVALAQSARTSIQGFGGITFDTSSALGRATTASALGGVVTTDLTPNIQVVGELGRMSDIKPPLYDLLNFTPVQFTISAWYGEGGVRFIASRGLTVRPYAEATAGVARLSTGLSGLGRPLAPFVEAGLPFLTRNEPLLGAGGGMLIEHGPITLDIGYRYKKITASGVVAAINAGNPYQVNEARIGLGVRF